MEDVTLVDKLCAVDVGLQEGGVQRLGKCFGVICQILLDLFEPKFFNDKEEVKLYLSQRSQEVSGKNI